MTGSQARAATHPLPLPTCAPPPCAPPVQPLLAFSQVMLVALALHCMGVPDGWEGRPAQTLALLTAFHAFLGQLPPVLEAAQQEVACTGCQLGLDVAAWQVGTDGGGGMLPAIVRQAAS